MASEPHQLHFLLCPLMAQGHMIPMVDTARILAERGVMISIITTPQSAARFKPVLARAKLQIQFIELQLPCEEAGLPKGCENFDQLPSFDLAMNFFRAASMLQEPVERLFDQLIPRPSCIISDVTLPWTCQTAGKFQIPRFIFQPICSFQMSCMNNLLMYLPKILESLNSESESFVLPGLPDQIEFTKSQIQWPLDPKLKDLFEQVKEADMASYGVVINTFEELEPAYVEEYRKARNGKLWCIGPVSLCNKDTLDRVERGNKASIEEHQCLKWLDSHEPRSVLYACLGSLCNLIPAQLIELGLGLEASNKPFIWVIREGNQSEELEKWITEYGLEEKAKGRGLLIRGWAPQMLILSHPAVGGFLTHCGWNSSLETICAGMPVVTWPMFGDQFFNEKLLVHVLGVGVRVGVEKMVHWGEEEKTGVVVNSEDVKEAIVKLIDGEEKEERRQRAEKLADKAKKAVEEGGSSHLDITLLIQDVMQQAIGHLIPMTDMARLLAQHGLIVTIMTTPASAARIRPAIDRDIFSGLHIQLVQLPPLPVHEFGLPEGCESLDAVPSRDLFRNFFALLRKLQPPVERLLKELKPSPTCLIADKNLAWTAEIARKLAIPRVLFDGSSCFALLCNHIIRRSKIHHSVVIESEPFVVPDLPDHVEFRIDQLPGDFHPGAKDVKDLFKEMIEAEEGAYGVVVNSFEELESKYVEGYKREKRGKIWCVGPVSLTNKTELDKAQRGNNIASIDEKKCITWLDSWPKNSVVYASLGSLCRFLTPQLIELGLGLEASNRPFIWVVRGNKTEEIEKWIVESGFEERTKGKGLLIHGWAPQVLILSHPSIGGFLTHCGWNSTLEGVCAGRPMITWPMFSDQFYNEKLIVQVLRIGESVGAKFAIPLGNEEKFGVVVKRREVKEAIDKVMHEGKEGEERRERAKMFADMAKKAIEEGGSSCLNVKLLIQEMRQI